MDDRIKHGNSKNHHLWTDHLISRGGGGLGFFLATSYFFLSFCTTSYF